MNNILAIAYVDEISIACVAMMIGAGVVFVIKEMVLPALRWRSRQRDVMRRSKAKPTSRPAPRIPPQATPPAPHTTVPSRPLTKTPTRDDRSQV